MFTSIKQKALTVSLLSFGALAFASPTYAINFQLNNVDTNWDTAGNVTSGSANSATINSGVNTGANPTVRVNNDPGSLGDFLGVSANSLNPPGSTFGAQFGSAIKTTASAQANDIFSFDYNFTTSDSDRAFVTIGNIVSFLSGTSGTYTSSPLAAGTYTIGIGVVDVDDADVTSSLEASNAKLVPEPLTMIGWGGAIVLGASLKRKFNSKKKSVVDKTT